MRRKDHSMLKDVTQAKFLREAIDSLKVHCPMGCGAAMPWETVRDHVRTDCTSTQFRCPHKGCRVLSGRQEAAAHEATCGRAVVTCGCGEEMLRSQLERHRAETCPVEPVTCRYCNQKDITRSLMDAHLERCKGFVPMDEVRR